MEGKHPLNNLKLINSILELEERCTGRMVWGKENTICFLIIYLTYKALILGFHISVFFVFLVLGKLKCVIPGDFVCPIAKLLFWLSIVAELFLRSSYFGHMCVRKGFELQT